MGTLAAKKYSTAVVLGLADHTYVSCHIMEDTKAWGCWGGKAGGNMLRNGVGSTLRADVIAEPDERAGVTCYGINGVCHQAANRILLPALMTVTGARGYRVSEALFGVYGRPRGLFGIGHLGLCVAPFNQANGVFGEHSACLESRAKTRQEEGIHKDNSQKNEPAPDEQRYLKEVLNRYEMAIETFDKKKKLPGVENDEEFIEFQLSLFQLMLDYYLSRESTKSNHKELINVRRQTELDRLEVERSFLNNKLGVSDFVELINSETIKFQKNISNVINKEQYYSLFDLYNDDLVVLVDPEIAEKAYKDMAF